MQWKNAETAFFDTRILQKKKRLLKFFGENIAFVFE